MSQPREGAAGLSHPDVEREIEVRPGESGRDYVLRVWGETREALQAD